MSRSSLLALVLATVGCNGRGLAVDDATAEGPLADGGPADGPAPDARFPPPACTPGADQTCNADPAMSALAGKCMPDATCMCLAAFVYDKGTSRCRPEGTCPTVAERATIASGPPMCGEPCPGEWATMVPLDVSDCATRTILDCTPQVGFNSQAVLLNLAQDCHVGSYTYVRVDFSMGCPTRLLGSARGAPLSQEHIDCLTAGLAGRRWQCTLAASCALWEVDTLR